MTSNYFDRDKAVVYGTDSAFFRSINVDRGRSQLIYPVVATVDSGTLLSLGLDNDVSIIKKFGFNADVGDSEEVIWGNGALDLPSTASGISCVSSSANDAATGTGAQQITIDGLDQDYNRIIEVIELNGTTPVVTVGTFIAVNTAYVTRIGSETGLDDGGAQGNITMTIGGKTVGTIQAHINQTQQALYTVPNGYTATLRKWSASVGSAKQIDLFLRTKDFGADKAWLVRENYELYQGVLIEDFTYPLVLPAKSSVCVTAKRTSGTTKVSASFEMAINKIVT